MFTNEMITSFNTLETSIYNYVSHNSEKVAYMRIRELASETKVSTATILRFCRKVNCKGFSEFKIKLKLHLGEQKKTSIKDLDASVGEFFERSSNGNLEAGMKDAAILIHAAENVIFIGSGSSGIVAEYGARHFSSLGKFSLYIKDPLFQIHSRHHNQSVTIALSVTGENYFTIEHINRLKQEGSTIISITNNTRSTIAKISDVNISYFVAEEIYKKANVTTQVPVVYIIESIAREVHRLEEGWY